MWTRVAGIVCVFGLCHEDGFAVTLLSADGYTVGSRLVRCWSPKLCSFCQVTLDQWDNSSCCTVHRRLAAIPAGHIVGGTRADLLDAGAGAVTAMSYSSRWDRSVENIRISF